MVDYVMKKWKIPYLIGDILLLFFIADLLSIFVNII